MSENDIEIRTISSTPQVPFQLPSIPLPKNNEYCGLINQGRTCYMNSLLQSLFMTPEFRNKILSWQYNPSIHGAKQDSIPYQLKKLFARMQLKIFQAEKTTPLTKSFQWDMGQVYQQHDIQELCRVLFDAIKQSISGNEDFIDELFQGVSNGVIKCMECANSRERKDIFLDLSLPVRNLFENINNNSLEMALKNYLKPEELNGPNQVECEICDKKCDALKYLQFDKLPKILFIQLGRFDFDYTTMTRVKINDKVTFPQVLNMNSFLKCFEDINEVYSEIHLKNLLERKVSGNIRDDLDDEDKTKNIGQIIQNEGPFVYELYSIMVHSGTASGGHYYAYIKSFENGNWYNFNDSSVSQIQVEDIQTLYGGDNKQATTGYILMYRIASQNLNYSKVSEESLGIDLINEISIETEKLIEEEKIEKERASNVTLKFRFKDFSKEIPFKKYFTIKELKLKAMEELKVEADEKNVRIRAYDPTTARLLETYPVEDFTLEAANIFGYKTYSFEIRENEDIQFEEYDPTAINLLIYLWEDRNDMIDEKDFKYEVLRISKNAKLSALKQKIYELLKLDLDTKTYCFKRLEFSTPELFNFPSTMVKEICQNSIYDNTKIYVEIKDENWRSPLFLRRFEKKNLNITILFNLPLAPDELKGISITSYKYENQFEMAKTNTIGEMKSKIAEILGLRVDEFLIKKGSHYGDEINQYSENLFRFETNSQNIYVEFGRPLQENETKITGVLCQYDYSRFMLYPYRLQEIGSYFVGIDWKISELKDFLYNEVRKNLNIELNKERILIREHMLDRPTKIYSDQDLIKHLNFQKGKKIIIQEYIRDSVQPKSGQIQISIREFDPSNWTMSEPYEILVDKKATLNDFILAIQSQFPFIERENLSIHKLTSTYNVYYDDFFSKLKFDLLYEKGNNRLDGFPYFVVCDGALFIIKDESKLPREPNESEQLLLCRPLPVPEVNSSTSECTALVAVPEEKTKEEQGEGSRVKNAISHFENLIVNPLANLWNSAKKSGIFQSKEEGIKINVKKVVNGDSMRNEGQEENNITDK